MNPLAIIAVAASALMGFGLMLVSDPETDTAGLVSESTVYTAPLSGTVGLDSPSDTSGSDISVVIPCPHTQAQAAKNGLTQLYVQASSWTTYG